MPFGLDLKSLIIGGIIAYFVVPRVMAAVTAARAGTAAA